MINGLKTYNESLRVAYWNRQQSSKTMNAARSRQDALTYGGERGIIKALIDNPSTFSQYTPEGLRDALIAEGHTVEPLGHGHYKGDAFENGGGTGRISGKTAYCRIIRKNGADTAGEYFKISTGKEGIKRYDRRGNKKKD